MGHREKRILGVGLGLGAGHWQTALGPAELQKSGFVSLNELLEPDEKLTTESTVDYKKKLAIIAKMNEKLAEKVQASLKEDQFPIVLGGDHSIAVGTWSGVTTALDAHEAFGLIWIDAHMDAHTPATTPSHNIHGMPLAALLGHGEPDLVHLLSKKIKLNPKHVALIGVRSFEPEEAQLLKELNVRVYLIEEVRARSFQTVFQEAIQLVSTQTKGFGITLDLDSFDPSVAPGTGTPEPGGLTEEEVSSALHGVGLDPQFKGLEIVEYDPSRDIDHKTARLVQKLIQIIFEEERKQ